MLKYILVFIFLAVNLLLLALNWDLFTTMVVVDLGFGEFNALPYFLLLIFSGIIIAIYILLDVFKDMKHTVQITNLQKTILTLEKDQEIAILKQKNILKKEQSSTNKNDEDFNLKSEEIKKN